jgi:DNA-binding NarL/FixJ family response regulator
MSMHHRVDPDPSAKRTERSLSHIPGPDRIQFILNCFCINGFVAKALMKFRARILVADDHAGMRERVNNLLDTHFEVVAVVNDGQAAVDATARLKPDLVLLDILMPKMDGIRAAQELKRQGHGAKVVFLSVQQDEEFVAAAFESGANAYVFKSRMHSDLVWAIDRALAGEVFVSPGAER